MVPCDNPPCIDQGTITPIAFRCEADCFLVGLSRRLEVALVHKGVTQIVSRLGEIRFEGDGALVMDYRRDSLPWLLRTLLRVRRSNALPRGKRLTELMALSDVPEADFLLAVNAGWFDWCQTLAPGNGETRHLKAMRRRTG